MPLSLTTVIIAQDEEERIARAIRSCQPFSDEILVIDGGSRDRTVAVAEALGCRVVHNPWPGYAAQRNFGARNAHHDWIFMLDADEAVDPVLQKTFQTWRYSPDLQKSAYRVRRVGDFFATWLDNRPEYPLRFYDRRCYQILEVPVHERPVGNGPVGLLAGTLWHHGFRSVADHVSRFNRYTDLEAERARLEERRFSLLRLLGRPPLRLLHLLLACGMWRKGLAGFTVAVLWSYYEFLREIKLYELDTQTPHTRPSADRLIDAHLSTDS